MFWLVVFLLRSPKLLGRLEIYPEAGGNTSIKLTIFTFVNQDGEIGRQLMATGTQIDILIYLKS